VVVVPSPPADPGSVGRWAPDLLGPSYRRRELPLGIDPDGEGPISATLVRHEDGPDHPVAALLVVHGLSDYFFHTHLADSTPTSPSSSPDAGSRRTAWICASAVGRGGTD